jgi:hypothetical protein
VSAAKISMQVTDLCANEIIAGSTARVAREKPSMDAAAIVSNLKLSHERKQPLGSPGSATGSAAAELVRGQQLRRILKLQHCAVAKVEPRRAPGTQ